MAQSHSCPASGGAHRFVADEAGVPICACGEIETSPEDALALVEMTGPLFPGERIPPRAERRRMVERISAVMEARGLRGLDIEAVLDAQERNLGGGGEPPETTKGGRA